MEDILMSTHTQNSQKNETDALKEACERFRKKAKVTGYQLTYDGNGKIIACDYGFTHNGEKR